MLKNENIQASAPSTNPLEGEILSNSREYITQFKMLDKDNQGFLYEYQAKTYFMLHGNLSENDFELIWNFVKGDDQSDLHLSLEEFVVAMNIVHLRKTGHSATSSVNTSDTQEDKVQSSEFDTLLRHCEDAMKQLEKIKSSFGEPAIQSLIDKRDKLSEAVDDLEEYVKKELEIINRKASEQHGSSSIQDSDPLNQQSPPNFEKGVTPTDFHSTDHCGSNLLMPGSFVFDNSPIITSINVAVIEDQHLSEESASKGADKNRDSLGNMPTNFEDVNFAMPQSRELAKERLLRSSKPSPYNLSTNNDDKKENQSHSTLDDRTYRAKIMNFLSAAGNNNLNEDPTEQQKKEKETFDDDDPSCFNKNSADFIVDTNVTSLPQSYAMTNYPQQSHELVDHQAKDKELRDLNTDVTRSQNIESSSMGDIPSSRIELLAESSFFSDNQSEELASDQYPIYIAQDSSLQNADTNQESNNISNIPIVNQPFSLHVASNEKINNIANISSDKCDEDFQYKPLKSHNATSDKDFTSPSASADKGEQKNNGKSQRNPTSNDENDNSIGGALSRIGAGIASIAGIADISGLMSSSSSHLKQTSDESSIADKTNTRSMHFPDSNIDYDDKGSAQYAEGFDKVAVNDNKEGFMMNDVPNVDDSFQKKSTESDLMMKDINSRFTEIEMNNDCDTIGETLNATTPISFDRLPPSNNKTVTQNSTQEDVDAIEQINYTYQAASFSEKRANSEILPSTAKKFKEDSMNENPLVSSPSMHNVKNTTAVAEGDGYKTVANEISTKTATGISLEEGNAGFLGNNDSINSVSTSALNAQVKNGFNSVPDNYIDEDMVASNTSDQSLASENSFITKKEKEGTLSEDVSVYSVDKAGTFSPPPSVYSEGSCPTGTSKNLPLKTEVLKDADRFNETHIKSNKSKSLSNLNILINPNSDEVLEVTADKTVPPKIPIHIEVIPALTFNESRANDNGVEKQSQQKSILSSTSKEEQYTQTFGYPSIIIPSCYNESANKSQLRKLIVVDPTKALSDTDLTRTKCKLPNSLRFPSTPKSDDLEDSLIAAAPNLKYEKNNSPYEEEYKRHSTSENKLSYPKGNQFTSQDNNHLPVSCNDKRRHSVTSTDSRFVEIEEDWPTGTDFNNAMINKNNVCMVSNKVLPPLPKHDPGLYSTKNYDSEDMKLTKEDISKTDPMLRRSVSYENVRPHVSSPELKSRSFCDKSAADAIESIHNKLTSRKATGTMNEFELTVRKGFENFIGFGIKCVSQNRPVSH